MKRNKIVSILEYSVRNKMLVGILAVSLIGAGGVFLSSNATISNNTIGINKTVLAATLNNDGNKACVKNGNDSLVLYTSARNSSIKSYISVGEMLTINSYSNGYYNVTVQETGATGYIASSNMQKIVSGVGYDLTSLSGTAYTTNVSTAVNLREEATMNSEALAKLKNNTSVELLGKQGDWYKVNDNGTTGYIYGEYIAVANTNSTSNSSKTLKTTGTTSSNSSDSSTSGNNTIMVNRTAYVDSAFNTVNVMKTPSGIGTQVATMTKGESFLDISQTGDWVYIEVDGIHGYILSDVVSFTNQDKVIEGEDPGYKIASSPSKPQSSAPTHVIINSYEYIATDCNNVPILSKPSSTSTVLKTLISQTKVYVYSTSNGWSYIDYNGIKGYVSSNELQTTHVADSNGQGDDILVGRTGYIPSTVTGKVYMMSKESKDSTVVATLTAGESFYVSMEGDGWASVKLGSKTGFIPTSEITYVNPQEK